jgi:hypothetical protein
VAAACVWLLPGAAQALELGDELSVGVINAGHLRSSFVSNELEMELDLTDVLSVSASAGVTHVFPTQLFRSSPFTHFGLGVAFEISQHVELDLELHAAPRNTVDQTTGEPGDSYVFRTLAHAFGGEIAAGYAAPGPGPLTAHVEVALGITHYSAHEQVLESASGPLTADDAFGLSQLHGSLTYMLSWLCHSLTVSGSYYVYRADQQTADRDTLFVVDGLPLEPVRYALRPTLTEEFGALELSVHMQYAKYISGLGFGWNAGARLELELSDTVDVSLSTDVARALYAEASRFTVFTTSVAVSIAL